VVFSDETRVQLGGVRERRRMKDKTFHPHVVVRRWKGFKEFIWWSGSNWREKELRHIWEAETAVESRTAAKDLAVRNTAGYKKNKAK
jgi:hypothetical protein